MQDQSPIVDVPRIGPTMWALLFLLMAPAAVVAMLSRQAPGIPNPTFWIVILSLPMPLVLMALPRKYLLRPGQSLTIVGLFYRLHIKASDITSVQAVGSLQALLAPGSIFCSHPGQALRIQRKKGMPLIISPIDQNAFLQGLASTPKAGA